MWFKRAQKVQFLAAYRQSYTQHNSTDKSLENLKKLGIPTELDQCTFRPTLSINEEYAKNGKEKLF